MTRQQVPPLLALPKELKAGILKMVQKQDEAWRSSQATREKEKAQENQQPCFRTKCEKINERKDWRGYGLTAVSMTSKYLNRAAAPLMFTTIQSSRAETTYFQHYILPRYSSFFRQVILDDSSQSANARALFVARSCPLVTGLQIDEID